MSQHRYELVLLGPGKEFHQGELEAEVEKLFCCVGLDPNADLRVIVGGGELPDWSGFPVAVWFGAPGTSPLADEARMKNFLDRGFTLFPIVDSLHHYSAQVPKELRPINGQEWDLARVSSDVMKGFRLLRPLRQVFISYRRSEAAGLAHQLFHEFNERGFRVFLDTASVDAGADFQNALWGRMADVDLIVLLDSPTALDSSWVHQELNRAHDLGLGVVQLIWPSHEPSPGTELSLRIPLGENDFQNNDAGRDGTLAEETVRKVLRSVESERIRSLSARRSRLVDALLEHVAACGATLSIHPTKNVEVLKGGRKIAEVAPFVGVPDSMAVYQHESGLTHDPTVMIYNGLGVDAEWAKHLLWLRDKTGVVLHQIDDFGDYLATAV